MHCPYGTTSNSIGRFVPSTRQNAGAPAAALVNPINVPGA